MGYKRITIKKTFEPNWFLSEKEEDMYDFEYQQLKMLAIQRDSYKEINKQNHDIFMELMFNGLRMNTLISDNKYYDEFYSSYDKDYKINNLIRNVRERNYNGKRFIDIALYFQQVINNSLYDETMLLYEDSGIIDVYKKNKFLHTINGIYVIVYEKEHIYLYKVISSNESLYCVHIYKLMEERKSPKQIKRFELFVREFNDINNDIIDESNVVALDNSEEKIDALNAVKCFRNIYITNKWFNKNGEFNIQLPYHLFCENFILDDKFKYKF